MKRGVWFGLSGTFVLVALAGCGHGFMQFGEREPWRHDAELACLKSGDVRLGAGAVQIKSIEGPGICGADFPLKVSALGEESPAMSYSDNLRPPASIPNASYGNRMPRWPVNEPAYPPPTYAQPVPSNYAPSGAPLSIEPPGVEAPPDDVVDEPDPSDMQSYPQTRPGYEPQRYPPTQPAYNSQRYQPQPQYQPRRADDIPDDAVLPSGRQPSYPPTRPAYNAPNYSPPPLGPPRASAASNAMAQVTPPATLACPLVSALDHWVAEGVQPAAMRWFGSPVIEIKQISSYSCREMVGSGTSTISEHAFGNALDVAGFTLADGRKITVKDGWHGTPEEQGFLHDVQLSACDLFTTVLAPGYNIYHYNHIHVDLMRRASGRHPCRPNAIPGEVAAAKARAHYAATHRGPAYTGSIRKRADKTPIAVPGEDGYVVERDDDVRTTGSIRRSRVSGRSAFSR
ncbi:MAG TPA: extensin family protein [Pseudolabrys sp.]|nr:extensin family protein [Pseudolabrys sp.]